MIGRRQVKQRMARLKLHLFLFHLKICENENVFYHFSRQTTELRKKYLRSIQMIRLAYSISKFNLLESHIAQFHIGFKK